MGPAEPPALVADESKRVPLIRETLERIAVNVRQKRISGSYYYDWDDKPIEYAVLRCGGLTEGGKVLSVADAHDRQPRACVYHVRLAPGS